MSNYHMIRSVFGGSDVFDDNGRQVGYSLPSVLGGGEDFYDMDGNPLGQSFEGALGGTFFSGENGSHGFMDKEFMMGRNIYMAGDMGERREPDFGDGPLPGFGMDLGSGEDL